MFISSWTKISISRVLLFGDLCHNLQQGFSINDAITKTVFSVEGLKNPIYRNDKYLLKLTLNTFVRDFIIKWLSHVYFFLD